MTEPDDPRHLRQALALAARGLGRTWPNPAVGCVIVAGTRVVGRGWTQPGGRPHAEAMALEAAGGAARGATAYVSLEPCAHHGRTPPCADALVAAGVARVVVPMEDPDPRVSGRGLARLREAGIEVVVDRRFREAAEEINAGFFKRVREGRPLVTLKLATSVDGRIATATRESKWITGPEARRAVHLMRAQHDAVLIGAGTARADDPMLDVREMGLEGANPVRIVADGALSLPLTGRLAQTGRDVPLWILHRKGVDPHRWQGWESVGAELIECRVDGTGALDPVDMLGQIGARGVTRVMCEGGGRLAASLLHAGLIYRLVQFQAGLTLGASGLAGLGELGIERLGDAPRAELFSVRRIGADTVAEWRFG